MGGDAMEPPFVEKGPAPHPCDRDCVLSCAVQSHFKGAVEDGRLPQGCQAENGQIHEVRPAVHRRIALESWPTELSGLGVS